MSTSDNDEKIIFAAAMALETAADRAAYLTESCGSDTALRNRILALLKARENQSELLRQFTPGAEFISQDLTETCGTVIGRYLYCPKC